jgi:peptide/nickel transport system permease protein
MMGPEASPEVVQALASKLGLDRPPPERYWHWVIGMLSGNLGDSYAYSSPVFDLIVERLAVTVPLAIIAMLLTTVLALVVGIYAASQHNRMGDVGLMGLTQIGIAIPNFWFAIMLILLFSVKLQWFSAGGFEGWAEDPGQALKSLLLPALSLAVVQAAILARITRSAVLEVMREDYVRTARAKGLSQSATLWGHVLRNAMIPVVTVMGLQSAELLAGTIVVENVFYLPGLGRLIFQSISNRDLIVVRNCVMLLATMVVVVNFVVDVLYAVIDPRVKASDI